MPRYTSPAGRGTRLLGSVCVRTNVSHGCAVVCIRVNSYGLREKARYLLWQLSLHSRDAVVGTLVLVVPLQDGRLSPPIPPSYPSSSGRRRRPVTATAKQYFVPGQPARPAASIRRPAEGRRDTGPPPNFAGFPKQDGQAASGHACPHPDGCPFPFSALPGTSPCPNWILAGAASCQSGGG